MALSIHRIDDFAALAPLIEPWRRLALGTGDVLPFVMPQWLLPWWRHFSRRQALRGDVLRCYAFKAPSGELVGFAPLMVSHLPSRGPLRLRRLQVWGADPNITELNSVVCRPDHEAEIWRMMLDALDADDAFDTARWWVVAGSPAEAVLAPRGRATSAGERPMFVLEPGPSWDAFKASRSRNVKESMRKGYNSLARAGHAFTLHVRSEPDALPHALDRFFTLHQARARQPDTVAHDDWFAAPASRAFLAETLDCFAALRQAKIFELEIGGTVVATRIGFVLGDALYLYYSGYRPEWGKYSVMTTTTAEALRWAIREGLRTVNLSFGRDVGKTRWGPREVMYRGVTVIGATARARLAARAGMVLEAGLQAARRMRARGD